MYLEPKKRCPHCKKTKELLGSDEFKDVSILIRDIDGMDDPSGPVMSKTLSDMTGQVSIYILSCVCMHKTIIAMHFENRRELRQSNRVSYRLYYLYQKTSVPNIFIDGKHFGGNSDIQEAHTNGTLKLV